MTPLYMPFTHISPAVAKMLAALTGPVVVYQPLAPPVDGRLAALSDQGTIQLRTPVSKDADRLRETLSEFFRWAQLNPGKSAAGAEFFSTLQKSVPFFDETAVSQIRADIKQYENPAVAARTDTASTELAFSARLFLAVAQENDLAVDLLNTDLNQVKTLEQGLLDVLKDADTDDFHRQGLRAEIWPEDAGARQTLQRIRAWATVADADETLPDLWVTTSPAVIDALTEHYGEAIGLNTLAALYLKTPVPGTPPKLEPMLARLADQRDPDASAFMALDEGVDGAHLSVTLLAAVNHDPRAVIRALMPSGKTAAPLSGEAKTPASHTLMLLVQHVPGN